MKKPEPVESSDAEVSRQIRNADLTLIVSSFVGFQGRDANPSQTVARRFAQAAKSHGCRSLLEITLQVVWDQDQEAVRRHIAQAAAAAYPGTRIEWIAFGQGSSGFQMETIARNARNTTLADNAGQLPGQVSPITGRLVSTWNKEGGAVKLCADAVETRRIAGAMKIPASADAGQYLCESILYELLDQSKSRTPGNHLDAGRFFHTPFAPLDTETDDFVRKLARVLFTGRR